MLLTPEQLHEVRRIIEKYHDAFIVNAISPDAVAPEILEKLQEEGIVDVELESIRDAYLYGQLVGILQNKQVASMSYEDFKKYVQKNPVPLTTAEKQAIAFAQLNGAQYCKGLGNRVNMQTGDVLIEADQAQRAWLESEIRSATEQNIKRRQTVQQLKTDLGWIAKDWARDWKRIAVTEKQNAMQHGLADHYRKRMGADTLVAKRPMPDACRHCQRLYLGPDGNPRIFKLSTLEANGNNVGRKAADWLPVVGTVHPNCQCQMVSVPEGWGFDEDGDLVPGGKGGYVYDNEGELLLALRDEMELQKSFQIQDHITFQGLPIAIENRKNSIRTWKAPDGSTGQTELTYAYGFIKRTNGADEDEIDCFVGPDPKAENVYIVEQQNRNQGTYDEQKVMLGFSNQTEAERAYRENFDAPDDFFLTIEPMGLDAFKRYIAVTHPKTGEMGKSGNSGKIRFVVLAKNTPSFRRKQRISSDSNKLQKGSEPDVSAIQSKTEINRVQPEDNQRGELIQPDFQKGIPAVQGAVYSPAGNRSPSGIKGGGGENYVIPFPKKDKPKKPGEEEIEPSPQDIKNADKEEFEHGGLKRDKEIYDFKKPQRYVRPIIIPEKWDAKDARKDVKKTRKEMVDRYKRNLGRPKNVILEKAKPHKYIKRWKKGNKWMYLYPEDVKKEAPKKAPPPEKLKPLSPMAQLANWVWQVAGKADQDINESDNYMVKVRMEHMPEFQQKVQELGLPGKVHGGSFYARWSVPKKIWNKARDDSIEHEMAKGKKPKKAISPPGPKPAFVEPESVQRLGEFDGAEVGDMKLPKVPPGMIQRGRVVRVTVPVGKGQFEPRDAVVDGVDQRGDYVVKDSVGKKWHLQQQFVQPVESEAPYKVTFGELHTGQIVNPTTRQKKLMRGILDKLEVVGKHTPKEYVDWLHDDGHEVYVVGGMVRDMLDGTQPDSDMGDEEILEMMKDVDLVTTAPPPQTVAMLKSVGSDLPEEVAISHNAVPWATVRAVYLGAGLDVVTMVQEGVNDTPLKNMLAGKRLADAGVIPKEKVYDYKEPPATFDHEIKADMTRRDFACNAVYYDPVNDVLLDPSGMGIADAQNKVLRFVSSPQEAAKNPILSLRYLKFRMKDYSPTEDVWQACRDHFRYEFKKRSSYERMLLIMRVFGAKGGTAEKHIQNLKKQMYEDGWADLYDKYIGADEEYITQSLSSEMKHRKDKEEAAKQKALAQMKVKK